MFENWNDPEKLQPLLENVILGVVILIIGWIVSKWANRIVLFAFRKGKADEAVARFLASIGQYVVLALTIITALGAVGIETTSLIAVLASAGLAVGLALQGSLANFASGVMILFFRPFNLGDKVTAGGKTGNVIDIGIFNSTLLTLDNERIIVPNSKVTSDVITNFSTEGTLRAHIEVGVAYGSDVAQVKQILESAAAKTDMVLADPAPEAVFVNLGASSLDFSLRVWVDQANWVDVQGLARKAAYDALGEAGIEIPFTQLVLHNAPE